MPRTGRPPPPTPPAVPQVPLLDVAPGAPPLRPAWPRWTDAEGAEPHTDTVPMAVPDTCFSLPWRQLQSARDPDGFVGHAMARRAVLLALRRLARRPLPGVPPAFTVFFDFCGPDRDHLVVGVSPSSPALDGLLAEHLDFFAEVGAGAAAQAWVGRDGLQPQWRYDHGHVIEYGEAAWAGTQAAWAGTEVVDGPEGLRTGLRLHRRVVRRAAATAAAVYGQLTPPE